MIKRFVAFIVLFLILVLNISCSKNTEKGDDTIDKSVLVTEQNDVMSPSGEFVLKMCIAEKEGVVGFYFQVNSIQNNEEIFKSQDFFRFRDTNFLLWGDNDTVWVYSGDLGTFYWDKTDDDWEKKSYAENKENIEVPNVLKQLRPLLYN